MDTFLSSLTALGEWLGALEEQYPWLTPVSELAGLGALAIAVMAWFRRRIVGKAYRIRREVEEKNERLEADLEARPSQIKCGSACTVDPAEGVIGVQSGPRRHRVPECSRDRGSRVQDAGRGDDREDPSRVLRTRQGHQGDQP